MLAETKIDTDSQGHDTEIRKPNLDSPLGHKGPLCENDDSESASSVVSDVHLHLHLADAIIHSDLKRFTKVHRSMILNTRA